MTKKLRHLKFFKAVFLSCLLLCCFFVKNAIAEEVVKTTTSTLKEIKFLPQNSLEISLSNKTKFKSFTLSNPNRLVIDIENCDFEQKNYTPILPYFSSSFRSRINEQKSLRLVFDLKQDLKIKNSSQIAEKIIIEFVTDAPKYNNPQEPIKYVKKTVKKIIVLDAGHGGKDPGTIGDYARTKEKNVTLSYAKELKKYLENTKKYQVFLTRDNDYFIPLKKRVEKARKLKADLFISLHANSINDNVTSGLSIYTLSEKSSDKQAELLAKKENRADIIYGADFSTESQDVMKTLIDLSQRDSMNKSSIFANIAIRSAKNSEIKILQNTHRFAGFAVLTAPDMASVLIELGYLSNKNEEKNLNNLLYKRKITESLTEAINNYFAEIKS